MLITTNGRHEISHTEHGLGGKSIIVYISDNLGAATLQLQYKNEQGNYIDLENGLLSANTQNRVDMGLDIPIYLNVTTSDGATAFDLMSRSI